MQVYVEVQKVKYRWFLVLFAVVAPVAAFHFAGLLDSLIKHGGSILTGMIISYLVSIGIIFFMTSLGLETQIDANEIRVRAFFFTKWLVIPWADVEKAYMREYAMIGEFPKGIMGFRQGPSGMLYSMTGNTWGLQLKKKSGLGILIGTQRPDELRTFLEQLQKQAS